MNVKPATSWITTDSDPLFINNVGVVLLALATNDDIYTLPSPALPVVQTALDNFAAAEKASADGGRSATALKNNLRLVLAALVRDLAHYVAVACKGNMANLILSGFPPQKTTRTPIGPLPAPQALVVKHGVVSGVLNASVNPVFGASTYNWTCTANTPGAVPITVQSTAADYSFTGLTPAVSYTIAVNAFGTAGLSNWSSPVSQIAI
jgi:hypothetical protein